MNNRMAAAYIQRLKDCLDEESCGMLLVDLSEEARNGKVSMAFLCFFGGMVANQLLFNALCAEEA